MNYEDIRVTRVSGALGAEVGGVDLAGDLSDQAIAKIRSLLLEHGVIFFRDQRFTAERQKSFARRFGTLTTHPFLLATGTDPEVIDVVRRPDDKRVVGEDWHSDTTVVERPPMGSILYAIDVPPYGGDTMFANQYLAYDALSDGLKSLLDGLKAENSDRKVAGPAANTNAVRANKVRDGTDWKESRALHPVVRTHPETGRKALYVNRMTSFSFEGMSEAESAGLLDYLFRMAHRPEFTCRFRWTNGAVAFWDNRCTQHIAINDTAGFHRHMRRVQIAGDRPR